jgi:formylglycine-generating enzyme required for sulfatase activity
MLTLTALQEGEGLRIRTEVVTPAVWRLPLPDGEQLELVVVEGGEQVIGSPETEAGRDVYPRFRQKCEGVNVEAQRPVNLKAFALVRHPLTQAQWRWVAGLPRVSLDLPLRPSRFKGSGRPVEQVNWYEAMEFCARLSTYTGVEFTLPSESQWEYACRAGTTTAYHFGDTLGPTQANYNGSRTCPVGYYPANAFGLHDMHGQVWEWCLDDWHGSYKGAPTDGSAWVKELR